MPYVHPVVVRVWIEEGCIVCDACETTCPDVLQVTPESCVVRPQALDMEFSRVRSVAISEAAEECPVQVIKLETAASTIPRQ